MPILLAAAAAGALQFVEASWAHLIHVVGLRSTGVGNTLMRAINSGTYAVLLQSVAAVTGVFLALYFTAIGTVAATVYATVPHDIRELMLRDKLGNVYVQVVAFLTALAVFLLVASASGAKPPHLALPVIGVLSAFSIFAFINLGQRAFDFADPTVLAGYVGSDFTRWVRSATRKGWRWLDPSFQDHYRQRAKRSIDSFVSLIALARAREHLRGDPQQRLAMVCAALLVSYLRTKSSVPTKSRWFGQRYEHKQWYLTDSTELQMATGTDAQLAPTSLPDTTWVERALLEPLLTTVGETLQEGRASDAYSMLDSMSAVWEALGSEFSVDEGAEWTDRLSEAVIGSIVDDPPGDPTDLALLAYKLGTIDTLGLLPISLELGLYRWITALDVDALRVKLIAADWLAPESPYEFGLPTVVIEKLEDLRTGVEFEAQADSPVRTPGWYLADVALNVLAWTVKEQFEACVAQFERWYPASADRLSDASRHEAAAAVLSRGLEAAWKLARHIESLQDRVARLSATAVLEDLTRPGWDWPALAAGVDQYRHEILKRLAASIPQLADVEDRRDIPDYFGHAVHRTGEACIDALVDDDPDTLAELLEPYFVGILRVVGRLQPQVFRWTDIRTAFTWMTEPLMDLVDVSGYALILSEYHQEPRLWTTCQGLWDGYVGVPEGPQRLALIATACREHERLFAISPRSVLRTQWQMRVSQLLTSLPRSASRDPFDEGEVVHPSRLIQRIAASSTFGVVYLDARDVFVARYLHGRPEASGLDFGIGDDKLQALAEDKEAEGGTGDGHKP